MATQAQIMEFINKIAPCAQAAYKDLGKVKPSICIGMACVESAYGTARSCQHNSFLGQKVGSGKTATKYWSGKFFLSKTKEEYQVGVHTTINAAFRAYDSMRQCVYNYYELLNSSIYKRVTEGAHYTEQMKQIKLCGYMTSSTEVNSVLSIIQKYNLTKYDNESAQIVYPIVKLGTKNAYVALIQDALNVTLGTHLRVDSIFGPQTEAAVMKFQENKNLKKDGIVGKMTWRALGF